MTARGGRGRAVDLRARRATFLARAALRAALLVGALALGATVAACSSTAPPTSAAGASNCEELVQRSAALTRNIVRTLQGRTEADLRAANPADPYGALLQPYDAYRTRADELGCDQVQLRRLACPEYQDIEPNGPAAEEFLSRVPDTCR